jgi:hypothetical protein
MYSPVDQSILRIVLRDLAAQLRFPLRLYLVGGTTLIYEGWRNSSKDMDFGAEFDSQFDGLFTRTVQELKRKYNVSIELVTPKDFIPLPLGWQSRCRFIQRLGTLDIFHFDPISNSLSKIERGKAQDFEDVGTLLREGWVTVQALEDAAIEIAPRYFRESLRKDPAKMQENLARFKQYYVTGDS